jgi:hypothetical protein
MDLISHAYTILPACTTPTRKEDPFTVLSSKLFSELLDNGLAAYVQREKLRIAIAFANCFGGWTFCEPQVMRLMEQGPSRVSAFLSTAWFPAAAQGQITIKHRLQIPALTFSTEFFAFYDALTLCDYWLKHNVCDVAFAGAAETVGSPFLARAMGSGIVNDAAVWFVLTRQGGETIYLKRGQPNEAHTVQIGGNHVDGSPLRGACALPLLLLKARLDRHKAFCVPNRALIRTSQNGLELWRMC